MNLLQIFRWNLLAQVLVPLVIDCKLNNIEQNLVQELGWKEVSYEEVEHVDNLIRQQVSVCISLLVARSMQVK